MKILIVSGGKIEPQFLQKIYTEGKFDKIIAADSGLQMLYHEGIRPTHIVGDFDSVPMETLAAFENDKSIIIKKYEPEKDFTDTQIAIELAVQYEADEIVVLGGMGNRQDHFLGNVNNLFYPFQKGIPCCLLDPFNKISLISERVCLKKKEQYGTYVSFLPFGSIVGEVTLQGFKYPLNRYRLTVEEGSLGVSNEITEEIASIILTEGILVMIESRD